MKHGFKAAAEQRALEERKAVNLTPTCRLDPVAFATTKGYPVITLSSLPGVADEHLVQLQERDPKAFSATAVVCGNSAMIVVNDAHTPGRQANSIAHELAHLLLGHPPTLAFADFGSRTLTKDHEDEADWFAGCLLVPASGIHATLSSNGNDLEAAAAHYGVSLELVRWRYNVTKWRFRLRRSD